MTKLIKENKANQLIHLLEVASNRWKQPAQIDSDSSDHPSLEEFLIKLPLPQDGNYFVDDLELYPKIIKFLNKNYKLISSSNCLTWSTDTPNGKETVTLNIIPTVLTRYYFEIRKYNEKGLINSQKRIPVFR